MNLRKPLPPDRTYDQLRHHYQVEREIADRLRRSTREERIRIYLGMYDELFEKVPDHPRLTRRSDEGLTREFNRQKTRILGKRLGRESVFAEFGPGDCQFAYRVAERVAFVYGVDISDQRGAEKAPDNFELIVYDGFTLGIEDGTVDVVFSDQLLEHFHPDDTREHLSLVRRILKPGGVYIFRTPHRLRGPSDVSGYFSDEPRGFHLKEWTYGEIGREIRAAGYSRWRGYWSIRGVTVPLPGLHFRSMESVLPHLPKKIGGPLARLFLPTLVAAAVK